MATTKTPTTRLPGDYQMPGEHIVSLASGGTARVPNAQDLQRVLFRVYNLLYNPTTQAATGSQSTLIVVGAGGTSTPTGPIQSLGVVSIGNTAGTSGLISSSAVSVIFVGGNNITLSQSAGFGSGTITINASQSPKFSFTQNALFQQIGQILVANVTATGTSAAVKPFNSSLFLQRIFLPGSMSLSEVDLAIGIAFPNSTSDGQGSVSQTFVLYSFVNSTSLASLLSASGSSSWTTGSATHAGSSFSQSQVAWSGQNLKPFIFAASAVPAGEYVVGNMIAFAGQSTSWTVTMFGANALGTTSIAAMTGVNSTTVAAASPFATGSSAVTMFTATPTSAPVFLTATGTSVVLAAVSAFSSSASAGITAFSAAPTSAAVFLTATGTSVALAAVSAHSGTTSAAITAFSAAPTSAAVFLTATGTSLALVAATAYTSTGTTALTAFTAAPTSAAVFLTATGTSLVLTGGSLFSGSTGTTFTALTATSNTIGVYSSGGFAAATAITALSTYGTGAAGPTLWWITHATNAASSFTTGTAATLSLGQTSFVVSLGTKAESALFSTTTSAALVNAGTATFGVVSASGLLGGSFFTTSGSASVLSNSGTAAATLLTGAGLLAGSFFSTSGSANVLSNSGTGVSAFLSSAGLLAGSFFTTSGSANVLSNSGTGTSNFMSTGGLLAGSFFTASGSGAMLSNSGTAAVAVALSFTTASVSVVGSLSPAALISGTFGATTFQNFGFIGTQSGSTTTALPFGFRMGVVSTSGIPSTLALTTTALTATGTLAMVQPYFALVGA